MSTHENTQTSTNTPRNISIKKSQDGFGFNLRGQVIEGGQVKAINGKLYGPLQHVSAVTSDSSAQQAGLRIGDKILQVNGMDVDGASHKQVVDLIKHSGDDLHLVVISSFGEERRTGLYSNERSIDYTVRRSMAISVPDYSVLQANGEKFQVFNVYVSGRHLCSRRYREFSALHQLLKQTFPDFPFAPLPAKWPFKLSDQQLDARRRGLEQYLDKICSVPAVGDCELVQDFLYADIYASDSVSVDVELKIMLPDRSISALKAGRYASADKVYELLVEKIGLPKSCAAYFFLFEYIDSNFERKLHRIEFPHQIYIHNSSSTSSTCLSLRKFVFSPAVENQLLQYPLACDYLYRQAVEQLERSVKYRATVKPSNEVEYIKYAQTLTDVYNTIAFPPCPCSSRKDNGHVIVSVNSTRLRLHGCSDDGKLDSDQIADFDWVVLGRYYLAEDGFIFEYKRSAMKNAKAVTLKTAFGQFMYDCFECILRELKLTDKQAQ